MKKRLFVLIATALLVLTASVGIAGASPLSDHPDPQTISYSSYTMLQ